MTIGYERATCTVCDFPALAPLIWIEQSGFPHGDAGHNTTYSRHAMAVCQQCDHAQLSSYSHDCWSSDEDWDMYWWYVLDPPDVAQLRALLKACPKPRDPHCGCSIHVALRSTSERLYGGIQHAVSPDGKVRSAKISLEMIEDVPTFHVKRE